MTSRANSCCGSTSRPRPRNGPGRRRAGTSRIGSAGPERPDPAGRRGSRSCSGCGSRREEDRRTRNTAAPVSGACAWWRGGSESGDVPSPDIRPNSQNSPQEQVKSALPPLGIFEGGAHEAADEITYTTFTSAVASARTPEPLSDSRGVVLRSQPLRELVRKGRPRRAARPGAHAPGRRDGRPAGSSRPGTTPRRPRE